MGEIQSKSKEFFESRKNEYDSILARKDCIEYSKKALGASAALTSNLLANFGLMYFREPESGLKGGILGTKEGQDQHQKRVRI